MNTLIEVTRSESVKSVYEAPPSDHRVHVLPVEHGLTGNATDSLVDVAFLEAVGKLAMVRRPTREPRPINLIEPPVLTPMKLEELAAAGEAEVQRGEFYNWEDVKAELGL